MDTAKKWTVIAISVVAALLTQGALWYFQLLDPARTPKGEQYAEKRVREMAEAANENDPLTVYSYLTEELRGLCTEEEFAENWAKERTYPYLIPFWIFYRSVELSADKVTGTATFERAARLPGQFERYGIVYENGGYYFDAFRSIADGSFISIFDRLS